MTAGLGSPSAVANVTAADRRRIVATWQTAAVWTREQLATVRRIEAATAGPKRDAAIRNALDRDDEETG